MPTIDQMPGLTPNLPANDNISPVHANPSQLLIKRSRLAQMLGMGCTMLRELHTQGHPNCDPVFPKPIRVTSNGSAFYLMSEVHAWIDSRIRKRDSELV